MVALLHVLKLQLLFPLVVMLVVMRDTPDEIARPAAGIFMNPLITSAPDPWVEQHGAWYYFTHTTGKDLRLSRTKEMSSLGEVSARIVWTPPSAGRNSKHIWAPEIHFLEGKWYFYYAADDGRNENHRMWVLENASADPFKGIWVDKGELRLPGDKWAIDGTVFRHGGNIYFLWSGWEGDVNVEQNIYITKMVTPWIASGDRVMLSKPQYDWELQGGSPAVNEAPQYLAREDKHFIIYSASGCWTDAYALGILTADISDDPLDPSSWAKSHEPVFQTDSSAHAYGPGHNSFFTSPDGTEDWILYHANPVAAHGCGSKRSTRMQKFSWTKEGYPDLGKPVDLGLPLPAPSGER